MDAEPSGMEPDKMAFGNLTATVTVVAKQAGVAYLEPRERPLRTPQDGGDGNPLLMRTVEAGPTTKFSRASRLLRDWRHLRRIVSMTVDYFTVGARVRRTYRENIARDEKFWLDREPPFV